MRASFLTVTFACAVTLLTGCSERNVGAEAGSEQTQSTAHSLAKRFSDTSSNATENASAVSMPAQKVIFDVLRAPPGTSADPLSAQELRWRGQLAGKARQGTLDEDERVLWDALVTHDRMRVRALITTAISPLPAWPITRVVDTSHGVDNAPFTPEAQAWGTERYAAAIALADPVGKAIADRCVQFPKRDSADAERCILEAYDDLDHDALLAQYDATRHSESIRTGESKQVHFVMTNGDDVRIDGTGMLIMRANTPWFGGGNLAGNAYKFSFAANASDTHGASTERGIEDGSGATQHTKASASVK